jgi:hypothetical protein
MKHVHKNIVWTKCQWLTPIILATQEVEIRRIAVQSQPGQRVRETLFQKPISQKIGLVEWLKVNALSSSPRTTNKKILLLRGLCEAPSQL